MVVIVLVTFALILIMHMCSRHRLGIPNAINEGVIPNKSINTKYPVREREYSYKAKKVRNKLLDGKSGLCLCSLRAEHDKGHVRREKSANT